MLVFVNLQIVIKEHDFMFKAGADVMAQVMSTELYTCYDRETGDVYPSSLKCEYDKPKYGTKVNVVGGSCGGSVETVSSEEDDVEVPPVNVSEIKKVEVDGQKIKGKIIYINHQEEIPDFEAVPVRIKLPPIPNVPRYVPVHRLAAIMAALGYPDYKSFAQELKRNGWHIADDEAKRLGLNLHDLTGLDAMLLKSDDGQSYVLVFAGTEISQVGDVKADVYQAAIGYDEQYESARQLALKLNNFLADKNLTFVGHSLGGGLATFASMLTGRYAITFNPAALNLILLSALTVMGYDCSGEKVYNYIMKGDPVSKANKWIPNTHVGSYVGHRIDVTNYTNGSAHGIKNMVDNFPEDGILYERREYRK